MKFLLLAFFLIGLINSTIAQNEKKLQKLLNKGKYDKVMKLGMKAHQNETKSAYPFKYMSWACWFKAQSLPKFSKTQWKYIQRSAELYKRHEALVSTGEQPLEILHDKLTLYLNQLAKTTYNLSDNTFNDELRAIAQLGFTIDSEIAETVNEKEEINSFSPFAFSFQEGNYETYFKAENINIPPYLIAKKADDYIGVPYKFSAINPYQGFDCSGYVLYVYQQFGVEFPHNTKRIAMLGKTVDLYEVQEGDVVCFGTDNADDYKSIFHIGMVYKIEGKEVKMIHCGTSTGVAITPITDGYWKSQPFFIKRLLTLEQERLLK